MEFLNQFGGHLLFGLVGAGIAYAVAHALTKSRNQQQLALLEHELESEKRLNRRNLRYLDRKPFYLKCKVFIRCYLKVSPGWPC